MTRFASIHEETRFEVIVRGIKSRAEAEAIVLAVERLPTSGAWIPEAPELSPEAAALIERAEVDGSDFGLKAGEAHE